MTPTTATERPTEERLLDAAEAEFSARGVHGASLRSIMAAAGTNVAAIHYHFGSREQLLEAVVRRRIADVAAERDRVLDEAEAAGNPADAHLLAEAFVRPVRLLVADGGRDWIRLIGRLLDDADPALAPLSEGFFARNERFTHLLRRLDPTASETTLGFRLAQAMAVALRVLGGSETVVGLHASDDASWTEDDLHAELLAVVASVLAGPPRR